MAPGSVRSRRPRALARRVSTPAPRARRCWAPSGLGARRRAHRAPPRAWRLRRAAPSQSRGWNGPGSAPRSAPRRGRVGGEAEQSCSDRRRDLRTTSDPTGHGAPHRQPTSDSAPSTAAVISSRGERSRGPAIRGRAAPPVALRHEGEARQRRRGNPRSRYRVRVSSVPASASASVSCRRPCQRPCPCPCPCRFRVVPMTCPCPCPSPFRAPARQRAPPPPSRRAPLTAPRPRR